MTNIVIRRLAGDEMLEAMYSLTSYALHASPPLTNQAEWNEIVRPRQDVTYMALFEDGALRVSTGERLDCDLTVQGLTALVYGTHDPGDFAVRGWGNPSPAVQAAMRALFPAQMPYLHERF